MHSVALKNRIHEYLKSWFFHDPKKWIHKSHIETVAKESGYLGDNAGRRLRELVEEGKLDKRKAGRSLEYRYLPDIVEISNVVDKL